MNQLAAKEAEAIGEYSGNIDMANSESQNRASIYDSQNRIRVDSTNAQIAMQEAEANAANRGMKKTTTNAYLNNLSTQLGQKSADDKAYKMQEEYQKGMLDVYNKYADMSKPIRDPLESNFESTWRRNPETGVMEKKAFGGPLNRLRTYKKFKTY
jgi:hypothetical protein